VNILVDHGRTAASYDERGYVDSFNDFLRDLRLYTSHMDE